MWLRVSDKDALVHKFLNFDNISGVDIDPKEGVRVYSNGASNFYAGKEGERISEAIEIMQVRDQESLLDDLRHIIHENERGLQRADPLELGLQNAS